MVVLTNPSRSTQILRAAHLAQTTMPHSTSLLSLFFPTMFGFDLVWVGHLDHVYMPNCTDMLPHNSLFTWSAVYYYMNKQMTKCNLHIVVLSLLLKSTIDKPSL